MKYILLLLLASCTTKSEIIDMTSEVQRLENELDKTRNQLNEYQSAYLELIEKHEQCGREFSRIMEKNSLK